MRLVPGTRIGATAGKWLIIDMLAVGDDSGTDVRRRLIEALEWLGDSWGADGVLVPVADADDDLTALLDSRSYGRPLDLWSLRLTARRELKPPSATAPSESHLSVGTD